MGFDTGSVSFRMFAVLGEWPEDHGSRFEPHAAPPIERMGTEPVSGWVGARHLLDLPLSEENTAIGGYPSLILMRAERKIPPALFRARCLLEEQVERKAKGRAFLNRKERNEIRARILEQLLPTMPPQLQGIPFVLDRAAGMLYAGALSDTQLDAFVLSFHRATGLDPIPYSLPTLAARRRIDVRTWSPVSFAANLSPEEVNDSPGQDFLTWLVFQMETTDAVLSDPDLGTLGFAMEGPLVFSSPEGNGAQEAVLRRGSPVQSAEADTCLKEGKKLRRARLTLSVGDDVFTTTFDADSFVCRGMKLPEADPPPPDPVSRFQERMLALGRFRDAIIRLADRYIDVRQDPDRGPRVLAEMCRWVAER